MHFGQQEPVIARMSHQPSSAGNKFEYFTLVRGSAIMGVTASRQII